MAFFSECLGLTVDKNIKLHAIRLFGSDSSKYSVTLNVCNYSISDYVLTKLNRYVHFEAHAVCNRRLSRP